MRCTLVLLVSAIITLCISCGDDATGPDNPAVSPSTLSLSYTSDSSWKENTPSLSGTSLAGVTSTRNAKGNCIVTASWTICPETTFQSYTLYRSLSSDISANPSSASVLGIFTDPNVSEYIDSEANWATEYFYALQTKDDNDNYVWSNEVPIGLPDVLPDGVVKMVDVGDFPRGICSLPSSEYVYVANYNAGTISVIRVSDNSVTETIYVGENTGGLCSLPSGEYVYAINGAQDILSVIRTSDNSVYTTVSVPWASAGAGVCALPSSEYVYVSGSPTSVIRTSDNALVAVIDISSWDVCALPSGDYVYATNPSDDAVLVIRTSDNTVVATVDVGDGPQNICALSSGNYVYVTANDHNVYVIRTSDHSVIATVPIIGSSPTSICALPAGMYVCVTDAKNNLNIIRTGDNTLETSIDMGADTHQPRGVCSLSSCEYVYVTNGDADKVIVLQ